MRNALAIAAGTLTIIAAIPYILDIIKGKTKPNIVSWLTWTLLLAIGTAGAYAGHEVRTALLTTGDLIGTGLTLLLGLKYGIAKFSWFDGVCQVGALLGLALWLVFNSPAVGIVVVIVVDLAGSIPTFRHSWLNPAEETWETFAVIVFATILTLLSLNHFSVVSVSYPAYLLSANGLIAAIVLYQRKKRGIKLSREGLHETVH